MEDIHHLILNNNSIFKVYQSKDESFLYSILAALYSNKIDRRSFHRPSAYEKYKKTLNIKNINFPIRNKDIVHFLRNNPKLNVAIRLFDSVVISEKDMRIYEYKVIRKGSQVINILFHKYYRNKKTLYRYFWLKNLNNISQNVKRSFVCVICYDRFSTSKALNRHLLTCNAMTKETYPSSKTFLTFDDKKAAKFASPLAITGFADFESKFDCINNANKFKEVVKNKKKFYN